MKLTYLLVLLAAATVSPAQTSGWEKEIVYQIFPRSFFDSNDDHVGDFRGITEKLDYIQDLGFTAILINPIFDSRFYHNYFADNFLKTDPTLGTNVEFFELLRQAHFRHLKVILDMEVQYVADKHPWYQGITNPKSPYAEFIWMNGSRLFGDKLPTYKGQTIGYATLNPNSVMLRSKISDVFQYWMAPDGNPSHGVDGFRIDHMMDDLDSQHVKTGMLKNFWLPIESNLRKLNPNIFFLAEQADWGTGADIFKHAKVDAVYATQLRMAWVTHDKAKIEKAIVAMAAGTPKGKTQFVFVENHDVERYASVVKSDPDMLRLGAVLNLTAKGTPLVYYGQELGMTGIQGQWKTDANDIPVRLAYRWTRKVDGHGSADFYRNTGPWAKTGFQRDNDGVSVEEEISNRDSLLLFYRRLTRLRASQPALQTGSITIAAGQNREIVAFDRVLGRRRIRVFLNLSAARQTVEIPPSSRPAIDLWTAESLKSKVAQIRPHGFLIVDVSES